MEHVVDGFCRRKEGGESSHKVQCKKLVEIRTKYVEKAKREIEEKIARIGVKSNSIEKNEGDQGPTVQAAEIKFTIS